MSNKNQLYSTTNQGDINYTTDEYDENKSTGNTDPPVSNPYIYGNTVNYNPKLGISHSPTMSGYSRDADDVTRFDEGFAGTSQEDLDRYRQDTQTTASKIRNTVMGGIVDGLGGFVEGLGYWSDLDTYIGMFGEIDYSNKKSLIDEYSSSGILQSLGKGLKKVSQDNFLAYEKPSTGIVDQVFSYGSLRGIIDSATQFALLGGTASTLVKSIAGATISKLGQAGKWGNAVIEANKVKNLGSVFNRLESTAKWAENVPYLAQKFAETSTPILGGLMTSKGVTEVLGATASAVFTKSAEAMMEGIGSYESRMEELRPLILSGKMSEEDAVVQANISANHANHMTMWTMAGDAMMLKGLFKGPIQAVEKLTAPGIRNSLLHSGEETIKSAPKEAFEEMWQEAANMEGAYIMYNNIKNRLNDNEKVGLISSIGFNPEDMPKEFFRRTAVMFDTNRAKIAGIIGAISGPMQSGGIKGFQYATGSAQKSNKEYKEAYNNQQEQYTANNKLADLSIAFADKITEIVGKDNLRELAAMSGEGELMDIANETAFMIIALENFAKGTTSQLEEVLDNNKSIESQKLKTTLKEMKTDFSKSKAYVNPEEVFIALQEIKQQQKIVDLYETYAIDPKYSPEQQAAYIKAVKEGKIDIAAREEVYAKMVSKKNQIDILKAKKKEIDFIQVIKGLPGVKSITHLESLERKYAEYPMMLEAIKERKAAIRQENISSAAPTTGVITEVVTPKAKETLKVGEPYMYKNEAVVVTNVAHNEDGDVEAVTFLSKNGASTTIKVNNLDGFKSNTKEELQVTTIQEHAAGQQVVNNKRYNSNGILIRSNAQQKKEFTTVIETGLAELNEIQGTNVTLPNHVLSQIQEAYKNKVDSFKSEEEYNNFKEEVKRTIIAKQYNIIKKKTNPTVDNITVSTEGEMNEDSINATQELIKFLAIADIKEDYIVEDPTPVPLTKLELERKRVDSMYTLLIAYEKNGIKVKGDLKVVVENMSKVPGGADAAKQYYDTLRAIFWMANRQQISNIDSIPDTFEALMGIVIEDFTNHEYEGPTIDNNKEIEDIIEKEGIYSPSLELLVGDTFKLEVNGAKNTSPAVSLAYQSVQWAYKVAMKTKKLLSLNKVSKNDVVKGSPILNPNKFNAGDKIQLKLDTAYGGKVKLKGVEVEWSVVRDAKDTWEQFKKQHKLAPDEEWTDYFPITVATEADGVVCYVHNVDWINETTTIENEAVILENKAILRKFKRELYNYLLDKPDVSLDSVITEKVIEINKDGKYRGFVMNRTRPDKETRLYPLASESLPDTKLTLGIVDNLGCNIKGNVTISNNILNEKAILKFPTNTIFTFVPLGKVDGEMKYHATPLSNNKLTPAQVTTIMQAIEIFITQDTSKYPELYEAYKNSRDNINFLNAPDLTKFLKKLVYLYSGKTKKKSVKTLVDEKLSIGKDSPIIEFEGGTITIAKAAIHKLTKGDKVGVTATLDRMADIVKQMLFNADQKLFNNTTDTFHFTQVAEKGGLEVFEGNYNEFVKQNMRTMVGSTLLDDSKVDENNNISEPSYGYTIQHIVRLDMNNVVPKEVKQEVQKEVIVETSDIQSKIDGIEKKRQEDISSIIQKSDSEDNWYELQVDHSKRNLVRERLDGKYLDYKALAAKINEKYDAELKALETQLQPETTGTTVEDYMQTLTETQKQEIIDYARQINKKPGEFLVKVLTGEITLEKRLKIARKNEEYKKNSEHPCD